MQNTRRSNLNIIGLLEVKSEQRKKKHSKTQ